VTGETQSGSSGGLRAVAALALSLAIAACGGGGGGGGDDEPPSEVVTVDGRIRFDRVPTNPVTGGLDYGSTRADPVRGVIVEAVDPQDRVVAETVTDDNGRYALQVASGRTLRIRVQARMRRLGTPSWDFEVVDNTSDDLRYALESEPVDIGATGETINLRAESGWDGASYAGPRAAAPFAILDSVRAAVDRVLEADPATAFPPLVLHWSPLNRESDVFAPADGEIVTTAYIIDPLGTGIFVLGDENVDTDEYDAHVIAHEWGHYLEDRLGRTDSPGGPHTLSARLDPRVAFSEGWSNAFAGIALDEPLYNDSLGPGQSFGFNFDLEDNGGFTRGWYVESSIHSVLYDLYDDRDDGVDNVALGFGPLYRTFLGAHSDSEAVTSIFSFATPLKSDNANAASAVDALLEAQNIVGVGMDIWAGTETNDAGAADVLPVYTDAVVGGGPVTVCSNPQFGIFNRLGVRQFVRFEATSPGPHRMSAVGGTGTDPDLVLFRRGFLAISETAVADREVFTFVLETGTHVLEVYEFDNLFAPGQGRTCFDVTVEAI
jgi:hypothetical protein